MHAYVFAAAQLGIRHTMRRLQQRDVDGDVRLPVPTIHIGRIWFPWEYKEGKSWAISNYMNISRFRKRGYEVWCKCNTHTIDKVPWPLPQNMHWVSAVTARYLHAALAKFGPLNLLLTPPRTG